MCFPREKTFVDGFAEYILDCKARNLREGRGGLDAKESGMLGCAPKEALIKSSAAEQRIFFPIRTVQKAGNTSSIPPLFEPSAGGKSLAVSSCRFNQSFPNTVNPPYGYDHTEDFFSTFLRRINFFYTRDTPQENKEVHNFVLLFTDAADPSVFL